MALLGLCRPAFFEIVSGLIFLVTRFLLSFFTAKERNLVQELITSAIGLAGMVFLTIVFQLLCRFNMEKVAWVFFAIFNVIGWGFLFISIFFAILIATGILKIGPLKPKPTEG